jgi:hypothetical protein
MKRLFFTVCFFMAGTSAIFAQKYMARTGKIFFNATAAHSPEKIEGINNEVASIIDTKTLEIVYQVLVKSFKFERQLMEEHFNENYMESDKYPKSDFKGIITNMSEADFSKDGTYNVKVNGKLTMHGITNDISVPGTITVSGNMVKAKTKFVVKLADYKITIPGMVADKISKEATIELESDMTRK